MKPYGVFPSYVRGYIREGKRKGRAADDCDDVNSQINAAIGRRAKEKRIAQKEIEDQLPQ